MRGFGIRSSSLWFALRCWCYCKLVWRRHR